VRAELKKFFDVCKIEEPPGYYAVLAFDGDRMGKWVSGALSPTLAAQFSKEARECFGKVDPVLLEKVHRPLSPSYHLQFSEALSNFGLYLAGAIVDHFDGQLIYSGGDDVLAMLPASTALDCAEALVLAFRGHPDLEQRVPDKFEVLGERRNREAEERAGGFVCFSKVKRGRPTWPMVVPGPRASASVGVAFGHIRAPLQGMVRAAQAAEKRAKGELGRNACAVSLFKRSGEILQWGFEWDSGALPLYRKFVELSSGGEERGLLSQRFGYALQELLRGYGAGVEADSRSSGGGSPRGRKDRFLEPVEDFPVRQVVDRELGHVLRRQGEKLQGASREEFKKLCDAYLDSIEKATARKEGDRPPWRMLEEFPMLFNTANFIRRGN
jgi:CRISPR/Cas system-associated protein Cas10 (large subunit of type III CRISPR-Cas system)